MITAGQVYAAVEVLKKLEAVKLPLKGKYWLGRIASKLAPEFQVIAEQRNELIKKHGEEKDGQLMLASELAIETDGVKFPVVNPAYVAFLADLEILMAQEIEVDCPKVALELLGDGETDVDLTALLPFIEEPAMKAVPKDGTP